MANITGKKFGGRQKGTRNRLTKELREVLKDMRYSESENIESRLDELPLKQRIELIIKLKPYTFPKLESISHCANEPVNFEI